MKDKKRNRLENTINEAEKSLKTLAGKAPMYRNWAKSKISSIKEKLIPMWKTVKKWGTPKINNLINNLISVSLILDRILTNLSRVFTRLVVVSFIVVMAVHLCHPDFATEYPVLYQWHNGWIKLAEFLLKFFLKAYYSLFTGQWMDFSKEATETIREMWNAFVQWISNLEL